MKKFESSGLLALIGLAVAAMLVWHEVLASGPITKPRFSFLDVGQGDSELITFPGNIQVMTDAGPDNRVLQSLAHVLGPNNHYIDLAIISHPQLDHFQGFYFILDRYDIGAFIINGRADTPTVKEWPALIAKIRAHHIPIITLAGDDVIKVGENSVRMLSPSQGFLHSGELNDTGFVERITSQGITALLTADTGANIEDALIAAKLPLKVDILKVGHHGSKYSTSPEFIRAVSPRVAVIEVGAKNHYGHPASVVISKLADAHIPIFRTDKNGTVEIIPNNKGGLSVFTEK